jgi:site-specific DNA recombinase
MINETFKTKRIAIYTNETMDTQMRQLCSRTEKLKDWCLDNGYEVVNEYFGNGGGVDSKVGCPSFQMLLEDGEKKEFDMVLVWAVKDLASNIEGLVKITNILSQRNLDFRSFSEHVETETVSGRFQIHVLAAVVELFE